MSDYIEMLAILTNIFFIDDNVTYGQNTDSACVCIHLAVYLDQYETDTHYVFILAECCC